MGFMFYLPFYISLLMTITISTLNVRSVWSQIRAQNILSFLSTFPSDIFLLQECSLPFLTNYKKCEDKWPHGPSIWSGSNTNKADGVAILIKNPQILVKGSTVVRDGRAVLLNLSFLGRGFNVLNIYGYPEKNDRYDLFKDMQFHLLGKMPLIFAGDFNCILQRKDRKGAAEDFKEDKTTILLKNIIADFRLTDAFKSVHPNNVGHTWFSGDGKKASRIYYIFIRDWSLTEHVSGAERGASGERSVRNIVGARSVFLSKGRSDRSVSLLFRSNTAHTTSLGHAQIHPEFTCAFNN